VSVALDLLELVPNFLSQGALLALKGAYEKLLLCDLFPQAVLESVLL
jgi:hypothetical protein